MTETTQQTIPGSAGLLGYLGVAPFAGLMLAAWFWSGTPTSWWVNGFMVYAAVILSFLGGIRWGVETQFHPASATALVVSVLPSLWAFTSLLLPDPGAAVLLLLTGFVAIGLADWIAPARGSAPWMRRLRARLTLAVVVCHLLVLALWL